MNPEHTLAEICQKPVDYHKYDSEDEDRLVKFESSIIKPGDKIDIKLN